MSLLSPPLLAPGDRVRVVAPSGPVPEDRFLAGVAKLRRRYEVVYEPDEVFARHGYLAGTDELRARSLRAAFSDREAKAVWMARGGYGLMRILPTLAWDELGAAPKWLVGFSDGTALLAAAARAGFASVHGPVITQLAELPDEDLLQLSRVLEGPREGRLLSNLTGLVEGRVQGPLLGGNLEVFSRLLGTPFLPRVDGAVLFIEDVGERPYRVDRLLTQLELSGILSRIRAALVGDFVHCDEPSRDLAENVPSRAFPQVNDVVAERLGRFGIPLAVGGQFGHGARNLALPYGTEVVLDAGEGVLDYA